MKTIILAIALAAGAAQAEMIECPAMHQGAQPVGGGMYEGDEKVELMGGARKARGGVDADFGFNRGDVKWVACRYETNETLWIRVSPAATRCDLKKRGEAPAKVRVVVRCK